MRRHEFRQAGQVLELLGIWALQWVQWLGAEGTQTLQRVQRHRRLHAVQRPWMDELIVWRPGAMRDFAIIVAGVTVAMILILMFPVGVSIVVGVATIFGLGWLWMKTSSKADDERRH